MVMQSDADLIKLQRQCRKSEEISRTYKEKTKVLIDRDKREIQRLQDDREELLRSLRVSQSCSKRRTDATVAQDLTAMLACGDRLDTEQEAEKAKVAVLKDQILKWERMLAGKRAVGGTTQESRKFDNTNLLKITRVENKLGWGYKCLNKRMVRMRELREKLKILQLEKNDFQRVKALLEMELLAVRKTISKTMAKCDEDFNASVKNQEKLKMLRDQNARNVAQHTRDCINLERELSYYSNVHAFLDIKHSPFLNLDINYRKTENIKRREPQEWGVEDFEAAITKILRETEKIDLDTLVSDFIQVEEQNYVLRNFINCQQKEVETIRREVAQLHGEKKVFAAEEQKQQEQHQALWQTVSIKQEASEQQLAVYKLHIEFIEKLLDQLNKGIKSLFRISYDSSVIYDDLGSADGVQYEEITEQLRMVEGRVSELFTLHSYQNFPKKLSQWDTDILSAVAVQLLGLTSQAVQATTAAAKTAACHDPKPVDSVVLEAKEPMSREDLLTMVNKRLIV
ncbi:outer dynein arm-docking complex subunit 1-like [Embiotoca jacksoni]|uniref:outer dynein arm-docking complex subunit 1-like n=1 Tax=Embiotoca jacksoni TaxID=100190 RepID=UPI0037039C56